MTEANRRRYDARGATSELSKLPQEAVLAAFCGTPKLSKTLTLPGW